MTNTYEGFARPLCVVGVPTTEFTCIAAPQVEVDTRADKGRGQCSGDGSFRGQDIVVGETRNAAGVFSA